MQTGLKCNRLEDNCPFVRRTFDNWCFERNLFQLGWRTEFLIHASHPTTTESLCTVKLINFQHWGRAKVQVRSTGKNRKKWNQLLVATPLFTLEFIIGKEMERICTKKFWGKLCKWNFTCLYYYFYVKRVLHRATSRSVCTSRVYWPVCSIHGYLIVALGLNIWLISRSDHLYSRLFISPPYNQVAPK